MRAIARAMLGGKQKRHLRALAHHLDPIVTVGKEGATESVLAAVDHALTDHELVKVRLPAGEKSERTGLATTIEAATKSMCAGVTGRIAILYRRHPSKPKITLPR
jgi:RNA-binding protein